MALWHHSIGTSWHCDIMALWHHGIVTSWHYWYYGIIVVISTTDTTVVTIGIVVTLFTPCSQEAPKSILFWNLNLRVPGWWGGGEEHLGVDAVALAVAAVRGGRGGGAGTSRRRESVVSWVAGDSQWVGECLGGGGGAGQEKGGSWGLGGWKLRLASWFPSRCKTSNLLSPSNAFAAILSIGSS